MSFIRAKLYYFLPMFIIAFLLIGCLSYVHAETDLEGDLNHDGKVNIFDLVTVAKDFGKKGDGYEGDANHDDRVDIFDLVIVAKNFGHNRPKQETISLAPEASPSAYTLLALRQRMKLLSGILIKEYEIYQTAQNQNQKQQAFDDMLQTAQERQDSMTAIFNQNPQMLITLAFDQEMLEKLNLIDGLRPLLEQRKQTEGSLNVIHIDKFTDRTSYYEYLFTDPNSNETFRLHLATPYSLLSNTQVTIKGIVLPKKTTNTFTLSPSYTSPVISPTGSNTAINFEKPPENQEFIAEIIQLISGPALRTETTGIQKILVIMTHPNDITPKIEPSTIKARLMHQVSEFYKKNSYNQLILDPIVPEKWYTLPHQASFYGDFYSTYLKIYLDTLPLILQSGIQPKEFTKLVIVTVTQNNDTKGGVGTIGKAPIIRDSRLVPEELQFNLSYGFVFIPYDYDIEKEDYKTIDGNLNLFDFIFAHELGHNLGAYHAKSIICENFILTTSLITRDKPPECKNEEYGNFFDVMGGGAKGQETQGLHFNAYLKYKFGWLDGNSSGKLLKINPQNPYGEYKLTHIGRDGVIGAWIPFSTADRNLQVMDYFLEYRKTYNAEGLAINLNNNLIDFYLDHPDYLTPTELFTTVQKPLIADSLLFSDLLNEIKVETTSISPADGTLTFNISKAVINPEDADMNNDKTIDVFDLVIAANHINQSGKGDVNHDGSIDHTDLELIGAYLTKQFGYKSSSLTKIDELIDLLLTQDVATQNQTVRMLLFLNKENPLVFAKPFIDTILKKITSTTNEALIKAYYDLIFVAFFATTNYPRLIKPIRIDDATMEIRFPMTFRDFWIQNGYDGYAQLGEKKDPFISNINTPLSLSFILDPQSNKVSFHIFDENLTEIVNIAYTYPIVQ